MMSDANEINFWDAVERADERYIGDHDKDAWIARVVRAGASHTDALQMFQDAHVEQATPNATEDI